MGGMVSVGSYVQVTTKREISLQPSQLEMLMSLLHLLGLISAWCWGCGGLLPRAAVLQGGTCNQARGCGLPQDALAESLQDSVVHEVLVCCCCCYCCCCCLVVPLSFRKLNLGKKYNFNNLIMQASVSRYMEELLVMSFELVYPNTHAMLLQDS